MSPAGCPNMSATPCNRNADESFPVLRLKSREQKSPTPLLIQDKDVLQPTYNVPPAGSGDWMNYLRALVRRYSGDMQTYGFWNEPNQGNWKGSPESYVQLIVNPAARTIKTACPACTVVAGELLHPGNSRLGGACGRGWGTEREGPDRRGRVGAHLTFSAL